MRTITLVCTNCQIPFERYVKEHKRCQSRGYSIACSRTCGAVLRNRKHAKGNLANLCAGNRLDELSPFRYYINKAGSSERVKHYGNPNISPEYLKELWETQDGMCPYTGKKMELPLTTQDHHIKGIPTRASLDRIDSSKGYVQGNVEFVCLAVNYAKNGFSKEQMIEFFKRQTV